MNCAPCYDAHSEAQATGKTLKACSASNPISIFQSMEAVFQDMVNYDQSFCSPKA